MSKLLSQAEIEALHAAVSAERSPFTGHSDSLGGHHRVDAPFTAVGFVRPKPLSAAERRAFGEWCAGGAGRLGDSLAALLRLSVRVEEGGVDTLLLSKEHRDEGVCERIVAEFTVSRHSGRLLAQLPATVGRAIVNRLLGGVGEAPPTPRRFTPIEQALLKRLMSRLVATLLRGGEVSASSAVPTLQRFIVDPERADGLSPSETYVRADWRIVLPPLQGSFSLFLPHALLSVVLKEDGGVRSQGPTEGPSHGSVKSLAQGPVKSPAPRAVGVGAELAAIRSALRGAELPLCVVVGEAEVRVQELVELQIGDVIQLDTKSNDPLGVHVGSRRLFGAYPIQKDGRVAIEIVDDDTREEAGRD